MTRTMLDALLPGPGRQGRYSIGNSVLKLSSGGAWALPWGEGHSHDGIDGRARIVRIIKMSPEPSWGKVPESNNCMGDTLLAEANSRVQLLCCRR